MFDTLFQIMYNQIMPNVDSQRVRVSKGEVTMKKEVKKSEIIWTLDQLKRLAKKMKHLEEFAYDTETNTLRVYGPNSNFKLVGISISWGAYNNYYIPINHYFDKGQLPLDVVVKYLKPIFENPDVTIICHNAK